MKKTLLATALVGILGLSAVMAATVDAETVKQRVDQLKTEFSLDDKQATNIEKILTRVTMTDEERKAAMDARMAARMEKHLARMKEKLGLNDDQVSQLKTVMTEQQAKMKALHEEGKTRMSTILTPEQQTKMQDMREMMMGDGPRMGGPGGGRGHGGHGGRMHGGDGADGHQCDDKPAE